MDMNTSMDHSFHPDIAPELLVRFLSGDASDQEVREVNQWAAADPKHSAYLDELIGLWAASHKPDPSELIPLADDLRKVMARIDRHTALPADVRILRKPIPLYLKVAASVALLVFSYFLIQQFTGTPAPDKVVVATATSRVVLPDGSVVFQHKGSRISYPEKMDGDTREVTLAGEAYFEVVKDPARPFLIRAGQTITRVVGTSFDVRGGQDTVIVTVLTGRVMLMQKDQAKSVMLTPGQRGTYSAAQGLTKIENDDVNFLSWQTGVLTFDNTPLAQVVHDLTRHFGQPIELQSPAVNACTWTSVHTRQTLDDILNELEVALSIKVTRAGHKIIVSTNGC